jgi:hypothetical protein
VRARLLLLSPRRSEFRRELFERREVQLGAVPYEVVEAHLEGSKARVTLLCRLLEGCEEGGLDVLADVEPSLELGWLRFCHGGVEGGGAAARDALVDCRGNVDVDWWRERGCHGLPRLARGHGEPGDGGEGCRGLEGWAEEDGKSLELRAEFCCQLRSHVR